jgi:uncharacterized membrane protein
VTLSAKSHMEAGEEALRNAERELGRIDGRAERVEAHATVAGAHFQAAAAAAAIESSRALAAAADALADDRAVEVIEPRRRGWFG